MSFSRLRFGGNTYDYCEALDDLYDNLPQRMGFGSRGGGRGHSFSSRGMFNSGRGRDFM